MTKLIDKKCLLWRCRRGILELDLLFMPFALEYYDNLPLSDKLNFQNLLSFDDPQLYGWFMGKKKCPDLELAKMIDVIIKRLKV